MGDVESSFGDLFGDLGLFGDTDLLNVFKSLSLSARICASACYRNNYVRALPKLYANFNPTNKK